MSENVVPLNRDVGSFAELREQCRERSKKGLELPGLDPLTAMRCRAYLQAQTARATMDAADTKEMRKLLQWMADAFMSVHDECADLRWFSLPGTVRAVRAETRALIAQAALTLAMRELIGKKATNKRKPEAA